MASLVSHLLVCGFICDILLVVTLIVFFIKYQKTMQVMLMAFISTNTKNSGIPVVKSNPVTRTFPPLFTINLPEEEKVIEELKEIKSMQVIVQVTMILVSIFISIIILYYCLRKGDIQEHYSNIVSHFYPYQDYYVHHIELTCLSKSTILQKVTLHGHILLLQDIIQPANIYPDL